MPEITEVIRPGWRGWWPNQSPLGAVPDTLLSGSNCVPTGPGKLQSFAGYGAGTATAGATMFPVKDTIGSIGTGSINYDRGDTYWWIGTGTATVGSSSLGAATSSLQLKIGLAGTAYTAGLARPVLAANALATNGAGNMTGTYSVKIAYKRSATGAVSNASEKSNTVSASSNKLQLTVPAPGAGTGVDRVQVFAAPRGFSETGPWLFLSEHTISEGVPTVITALGPFGNGQWADGDRSSYLAPLENFAPPTGTHVLTLGSVKCVLGCYGGAGIAFSFPAKPESFSPDRVSFLPGPVVGVAVRPSDGFAYVWGTNYVAAVILVPGGYVLPRLMWSAQGLADSNSACLVESELWAYTNEPVRTRTDGDPDTSFAIQVRDYMRSNWTGEVVVGYSEEWNAVVYFHGSEAIAYYRGLDAWSTPLTGLSGSVRAAAAAGNRLFVADAGGTVKRFGGGSGTTGTALTVFSQPNVGRNFTLNAVETAATGGVTFEVFTNMDTATSQGSKTISGVGNQHSAYLYLNVINCRSVALKYTVPAGGAVYQSTGTGVPDGARI
mgnify:FL=1